MTTTSPPTTAVAARAVDATKIYGEGRDRGARARRCRRRRSSAARTPRSWARRARGSRRCCTASPVSTRSRAGQVFLGDIELSVADREASSRRCAATRSDSCSRPTTSSRRSPRWRTSRCRWRSRAGTPTRSGSTTSSTPSGCGSRLKHRPVGALRRSAAARRRRPRAREPARDRVRRRAHRQPRLARERRDPRVHEARRCEEFGQTIVMVTHDPIAASYASRVVFLADGKITDEIRDPTRDAILDKMRRLGA